MKFFNAEIRKQCLLSGCTAPLGRVANLSLTKEARLSYKKSQLAVVKHTHIKHEATAATSIS